MILNDWATKRQTLSQWGTSSLIFQSYSIQLIRLVLHYWNLPRITFVSIEFSIWTERLSMFKFLASNSFAYFQNGSNPCFTTFHWWFQQILMTAKWPREAIFLNHQCCSSFEVVFQSNCDRFLFHFPDLLLSLDSSLGPFFFPFLSADSRQSSTWTKKKVLQLVCQKIRACVRIARWLFEVDQRKMANWVSTIVGVGRKKKAGRRRRLRCVTSGGADEVLDFFDERFDGQTGLLQFALVRVQVLAEVRTVRQALGELQRQEPHL